MKKKILILATTAKEAGALSILKDFIQELNDIYLYDIFIHSSVINELPKKDNINYIILNISSWIKRIFYDIYKYPTINEKKYSLCINFQNIPIRTNIKQIVYYHQAIPFSEIKFSPFKKSSRKLWLYKNFYLLFFKMNINYLNYLIVQAEWMKDSVHSKFNLPKEKIFIIEPKVNILHNEDDIFDEEDIKHHNILFYPAYGHEYKNHKIIIDSIKNIGIDYLKKHNIKIIFTIDKEHNLAKGIINTPLEDYFLFIGKISREKVFYYYRLSSIILFPSILETYGLPLKEASLLNKNIIASNLPYAKEVLKDYDKIIFCCPYNKVDWALKIKKIIENDLNIHDSRVNKIEKNLISNNKFLILIEKLIKE
ncbi:glycosyltransferase [Proteus sp. TJ1640]|uniref:glycosyltransferase n=1 Tax=Proteus sp. TJ1640 TaxID=2050968 RepID=UPI000D6861B0|nr:glycosyltransferase [Proteus sp. TJ1640]